MVRLANIHPGEVLKEEFLKPLEVSAYKLSKDIGIPQTRISEILKGRRITADTALRLSYYFGTTPKFWLGLQDDYDLEEEERAKKSEFGNIKRLENNAAYHQTEKSTDPNQYGSIPLLCRRKSDTTIDVWYSKRNQ
jgi:addiction module HigA family antidote